MYIGSCLICNLGCWGNDVLTVKIKVNKQRPKVQSFDREKKKKKKIHRQVQIEIMVFSHCSSYCSPVYRHIYLFIRKKLSLDLFAFVFLQAILLPKRTLKLSR